MITHSEKCDGGGVKFSKLYTSQYVNAYVNMYIVVLWFSRFIPEGLGCSCGPDWYTHNEEFHCTSYTWFLMVTCFVMPITVIVFSYGQLLGALRAVSSTL